MNFIPIVLASCGWLLMVAPLDEDGAVNSQLPLSKWNHKASFDAAKECEAEIAEGRMALSGMHQWAEQQKTSVRKNAN